MGAFKDKVKNTWLTCSSYWRYFTNKKPKTDRPKDTEEYTLKFHDYFSGNTIDRSKWYLGQPWGEFHPDYPYQYYGNSTEFINVNDGILELYTIWKPKKFHDFKNSVSITIPYGIGLVNSNQSFKYGYYEIEAILPQGKYLWPAIWLTAVKTWPPEIDILEAYSGKEGNYENKWGIKHFKNQPNIHYGFVQDKTKSSYGGFSCPIPKNPTRRFVKYALHWTEGFIKIYYDGHFVFQCTQKNILDYFNKNDVEMTIILNNAILENAANMILKPSVFKIKSVKFFSKN